MADGDYTLGGIKLSIVTSDDYDEEYEEETFHILNRGRKKDYGNRWGIRGTLTAQVYDEPGRTARQAKQEIETMLEARTPVTLSTPFGDEYFVVFTAKISRIAGVGEREFHTLTINYEEVYPFTPFEP